MHRRVAVVALVAAGLFWACGTDDGGNDPGGTDAVTPADEGSADEGPAADATGPEVAPDPGPALTDDGPAPADPGPVDPGPQPVKCEPVPNRAAGLYQVDVDGKLRQFRLTVPKTAVQGTRGSFAVVFNWHGVGDTAINMEAFLNRDVDYADMPFLLVTPEDAQLTILDWDMMDVYDAPSNAEGRLFDEVVACLDAMYGVDRNHIHSFGFSAGSVMSDLLGVVRGDQLASIFTFSGGYLSDPANDTGGWEIIWPDLETANKYVQVISHGGTQDQWGQPGFIMINFGDFARNDTAYLNGLGHDVILCNHGGKHQPDYSMGIKILDFFRDHPLGTAVSPYAAALPEGWPAYCAYEPATAE